MTNYLSMCDSRTIWWNEGLWLIDQTKLPGKLVPIRMESVRQLVEAIKSLRMTRFEEGLSYSAQRLVAVFPRRFPTMADAMPYARNPAALANKIYANRMGNGPPESGDGYRFRGRGPIQLTGRQNYTRCGEAIGVDLIASPDLILVDQAVGSSAACWFWTSNGLPMLAARGLFAETTNRINGGLIGQPDRERWLAIARGVL